MAKVLYIAGGFNNTGADSTNRYVLAVCPHSNPNTSGEAITSYIHRASGVFSNIFLKIITNPASGDGTLTYRADLANGNGTVTIGAGLTGVFEDTMNTDSNTAGADEICLQWISGAGGTTVTTCAGAIFTPDADTRYTWASFDNTTLTNGTRYYVPIGVNGSSTVEAADQHTMRSGATVSNFWTTSTTNTRSIDVVFNSRKNTMAGGMTHTIPAGMTGDFEDTMGTDSLSSGDEFGFQALHTGGSGSCDISVQTCLLVNTTGIYEMGCSGVRTPLAGTTTYWSLGATNSAWASEAGARVPVQFAQTINNPRVYVRVNTVSDASTLNVLKDGGGVMAVSITGSGTGWFEDTMDSEAYTASEFLNFELAAGATGTSLEVRHILVNGAETVSTGPPTGSLNLLGAGR